MSIRRLERDDWGGFCIRSPRELYVDEEPLGIISFEVIDAEGMRQIVTLQDPLLLPAPRLSGT